MVVEAHNLMDMLVLAVELGALEPEQPQLQGQNGRDGPSKGRAVHEGLCLPSQDKQSPVVAVLGIECRYIVEDRFAGGQGSSITP